MEEKEAELSQLRERIGKLKKALSKDMVERDQVRKSLGEAERAIALADAELTTIKQRQKDTQEELRKVNAQVKQQRQKVSRQSEVLSSQIRSAYVSGGRVNMTKFVLSANDPIALARTGTYLAYISRHSSERLEQFRSAMSELESLEQNVAQVLEKEKQLERRQQTQLEKLAAAKKERAFALASLESRIADQNQEVERLANQEVELNRLLQELAVLLADYPEQTEEAFQVLKGQLQWPVPGRILHDFGQTRAPKIQWRGVVIAADNGTAVRAIARGRVTYADWLPGLGLLLILDHGQGYMSLYGYNQGLAKSLGDWVSPGDTVAWVGDTGGQIQTSLYFEIRRSGKPENPHNWFKSARPKPIKTAESN